MIELKVGDRVSWTSHAQGNSATKIGTVIEVVEPGKTPIKHAPGRYKYGRGRRSYVIGDVLVDRWVDKERERKMVPTKNTYWPDERKLSAVSEEPEQT